MTRWHTSLWMMPPQRKVGFHSSSWYWSLGAPVNLLHHFYCCRSKSQTWWTVRATQAHFFVWLCGQEIKAHQNTYLPIEAGDSQSVRRDRQKESFYWAKNGSINLYSGFIQAVELSGVPPLSLQLTGIDMSEDKMELLERVWKPFLRYCIWRTIRPGWVWNCI